jgi:hypothetical protein
MASANLYIGSLRAEPSEGSRGKAGRTRRQKGGGSKLVQPPGSAYDSGIGNGYMYCRLTIFGFICFRLHPMQSVYEGAMQWCHAVTLALA